MKICFMYILPKLSNSKKKGKIQVRPTLTLQRQNMLYHFFNTFLPVIPGIVDSLPSVIKK